MATPRAPRRDAAENRELLLDAARTLLSLDPAASLEAIAVEAGLSRRAMYGHFPNRDALLEALARRGTQMVLDAVASVDDPDPLVRLALVATAAWDHIEHVRTLTSATVRSPRAAIVDDGLQPLRARLVTTIEQGVRDGVIRDDIPADRLARLLIDVVIAVFTETTRSDIDIDGGRELVAAMTLSTLGLSASESAALLGENPQITAPRPRVDSLWPPTEAIRIPQSATESDGASS